MCKIAILDPERVDENQVAEAGMQLYRSQRSGLGIVAVVDMGSSFMYHDAKWLEPTPDDVAAFIETHSDDAEWFILHGRLATSGARNSLSATHPIEVNCSECDIDYVLHNGVYAHGEIRHEIEYLEDEHGHEFTTSVDTELMAHRMGKVPQSLSEADDLLEEAKAGFEQGLILLGDEQIMLYSSRKYRIDENGEMYLSYAEYANDNAEKDYSLMLISPGTEEQ